MDARWPFCKVVGIDGYLTQRKHPLRLFFLRLFSMLLMGLSIYCAVGLTFR
jgi:hypothetical protein